MEDRIGSQGMWRLKEICSENLELMNAGIILRNNGKLPIFYIYILNNEMTIEEIQNKSGVEGIVSIEGCID